MIGRGLVGAMLLLPTAALSNGPPRPEAAYELSCEVTPEAGVAQCEGSVRWMNQGAVPVRTIHWQLYPNAFLPGSLFRRTLDGTFRGRDGDEVGNVVLQRLAFGGESLLAGASSSTEGDSTEMSILLPEPVPPGEDATFDVAFETRLPRVILRSGTANDFFMLSQWFPRIARQTMGGEFLHAPAHGWTEYRGAYSRFSVDFSYPTGWTMVANGPILPAAAGDRTKARLNVENAIDVVAAFLRTEQRSEVVVDGVTGDCVAPAKDTDFCSRMLALAKRALPVLAARYGPYPYDTLSIVGVPPDAAEAGGMEYPGLVTVPPAQGWGIMSQEVVLLHELAHQWFYGAIATDEVEHPWMDEGMATYAHWDAYRTLFGSAPPIALAEQLRRKLPFDPTWVVRATAATGTRGTVTQPAAAFTSGAAYRRGVYGRAPLTLLTMENLYEDPWRKAVDIYARLQRFRHPEPSAFFAAVESSVGPEAARIVEAELRREGASDARIARWEGESIEVERDAWALAPITVRLFFPEGPPSDIVLGPHERTLQAQGARAACVDPEHKIVSDPSLRNNIAFARPTWIEETVSLLLGAMLSP